VSHSEQFVSTIINKINIYIFIFFNQNFSNNFFNKIAIITDYLADPISLITYFSLICFFGIFLIYRNRKNIDQAKIIYKNLLMISLTLIISSIFSLVIINTMIKYYTQIARPYCSLEKINIIESIVKRTSCNKSFPSGHVTFAVTLVGAFWPMLDKTKKYLAVFFIILVAISRMVAGVHYPIDICAALALSLPAVILIRAYTFELVNRYSNFFVHFLSFIIK